MFSFIKVWWYMQRFDTYGRNMSYRGDSGQAALIALGSAAVRPLIEALSRKRAGPPHEAAEALGMIGDPRAVEPLIRALADREDFVRGNAAEALGRIKDIRAVEPLLRALADRDHFVRSRAAEALGRIKDIRAVEPLIRALADRDHFVRSQAAEALGRIKDIRAVEPLIHALNSGNCNWGMTNALKEFKMLGDSRVVAALIQVLGGLRRTIDVRCTAANALGEIASPLVMAPLTVALSDKEREVAEAAALALAELGCVQPLIENFVASGGWQCTAVEKGLKRLGKAAVEPVIKKLDDNNPVIRRSAADILGESKDLRAVGPLIRSLGDKDDRVRKASATALKQFKDPQAVEPLILALSDKDNATREAAAEALLVFSNNPPQTMITKWSLIASTFPTQQHTDHDTGNSSDCTHVDEGKNLHWPSKPPGIDRDRDF